MPIFKRKKATEKQIEEIGKINNFWQLSAFVIIESPGMFFAFILGTILIILALKFSGKIGDLMFSKSVIKYSQISNSTNSIIPQIPNGIEFKYKK